MSRSSPPPSVAGWKILDRLGSGSMGTVWKARRDDGALAALKVSEPVRNLSASDSASLFRRESAACLNLDHPNLVRGLEAGTTSDGRRYLAMEFVEGRTLTQTIRDEGALPEPRLLAIATALAHGLDRAHRLGLVHRDVKPANVLLAADGGVKLADLGLVVESAEGAQGHRLATLAYCAPEVRSGERAGPRSDLYSLGATIAEAAIGGRRGGADGSEAHVLLDTLRGAPISGGLRAVLERLLRPDAAKRYASAAEVLLDLDALAAGERPLGAILGAGAAALPRTASARRAVWIVAGVVVVAAAAVIVATRPRAEPSVPAPPPRAETTAEPVALAAARIYLERFPDDFIRGREMLDECDRAPLTDAQKNEAVRLRAELEERFSSASDQALRERTSRAGVARDAGDLDGARTILLAWPKELSASPQAREAAALADAWLASARAEAEALASTAETTSPAGDAAETLARIETALARNPFDGDQRARLESARTRIARDAAAVAEAAASRTRTDEAMTRWREALAREAARPRPETTLALLRDAAALPAHVAEPAARVLAAWTSADEAVTERLAEVDWRKWAGPCGDSLRVGVAEPRPSAGDVFLSPLWRSAGGSTDALAEVCGGRDEAAAWLFVHGRWADATAAGTDVAGIFALAPVLASAADAEFIDENAQRNEFTLRDGPLASYAGGHPVLSAWALAIARGRRPAPPTDARTVAAKKAGRDAFLADDLAVAWASLTEATNLDPWDAEIAALRGRVLLAGARGFATAPALLLAYSEGRRASDVDPNLPAAWALAAEAGIELCAVAPHALAARVRPRAAEACEQAARLNREDARFLAFAGEWHLDEGRAARAAELLRRAAVKAPGSGAVLLLLARAELAAGRRDRAADALRRAKDAFGGELPESAAGLAAELAKQ